MDLSQPHISKETIETLLAKVFPIRINANNLYLYQRAFVHKSVQKHISEDNEVVDYVRESNERLELVGDSVLATSVITYLYHKYPNAAEGELTKRRTRIVRGKTLAKLAIDLGLQGYILMSDQVLKVGGYANHNLLEDAMEALLGAIFLDHGYQVANQFIIRLIETFLDDKFIKTDDNYKDILLRYTQGINPDSPPIYEILRETGKPNEKEFTVIVYLYGKIQGKGKASKKKEAEQRAAKFALKSLKIEPFSS